MPRCLSRSLSLHCWACLHANAIAGGFRCLLASFVIPGRLKKDTLSFIYGNRNGYIRRIRELSKPLPPVRIIYIYVRNASKYWIFNVNTSIFEILIVWIEIWILFFKWIAMASILYRTYLVAKQKHIYIQNTNIHFISKAKQTKFFCLFRHSGHPKNKASKPNYLHSKTIWSIEY